jgi:hypothetical protein
MKKLSFILLAAVALLTSCHKDILNDIDGLKGDVADLQTRVEALETLCKQMNTNIGALQTIVAALQQNDHITAITEIKEGDAVIGYTISFQKNGAITIYNGAKGEDAAVPAIGVKQADDGIYYWTLDGEFLKDADGNALPVYGEDGISPTLRIDENDGYWYLNFGGYEQQLIYATGDSGSPMFLDVTYDDGYVYFKFSDEITLQVRRTTDIFTLTYDANGGEGTMEAEDYDRRQVAVVKDNAFSRTYFVFTSWNSKADGTGAVCTAGDELVLTKNVTLYAQWELHTKFSVADDSVVVFSPGNLQYHPQNKAWRFALHQYDIIGKNNEKVASNYNGWLDLFCWGTGDNPTKYTGSFSDFYTFTDWGANVIGNYAASSWRTLSNSEWIYLFQKRTNAESLYAFATVNGVGGVIVLPDEWVSPTGITIEPGTTSFDKNVLDLTQWVEMENNGAIFLPAAGLRNNEPYYFSSTEGNYWTSTPFSNKDSGYYLNFGSPYNNHMLRLNDANSVTFGMSVRLVKDLQ